MAGFVAVEPDASVFWNICFDVAAPAIAGKICHPKPGPAKGASEDGGHGVHLSTRPKSAGYLSLFVLEPDDRKPL